jgi:hypothetical protein
MQAVAPDVHRFIVTLSEANGSREPPGGRSHRRCTRHAPREGSRDPFASLRVTGESG